MALATLVAVPTITYAVTPQDEPATPAGRLESLLTKEDVLNFLRTRLGDRPLQNPNQATIKKELVELIKRRGVDFHYQPLTEFSRQLNQAGPSSEMKFALQDNFGLPTKQGFLMDAWSMDVVGGRVNVVVDNRLMRQGESAAKAGVLTISPNGTYVWQVYHKDPVEKHIKGAWHQATPTEMMYQGGYGIVLTAAKGGWDWIVLQDRTVASGEKIRAFEITTRKMREFGSRMGRR